MAVGGGEDAAEAQGKLDPKREQHQGFQRGPPP